MARQLSLFDDNPIPKDHVGGFRDFLPPELHDFGRPGRLTLIISSNRFCHNDFIQTLANFVKMEDGIKLDSSLTDLELDSPLTDLWFSLCLKLDGTTVLGAFNPLNLLKERKRLKILIDGCRNNGYARIRAATRNDLRRYGADIFSVEYSDLYSKWSETPLSNFIIQKVN